MMFKTFVIVGLLACTQASPLLTRSGLHVSEAVNGFGFNLYKQLATKPGNVLVSPWSAHNVFSLAYFGAEGNTADEMAAALQLENSKDKVYRGFKEIHEVWSSQQGVSTTYSSPLSNANALFPTINAHIEESYKQAAKEAFNASVIEINLANSEEAARKINRYVEQNTDGHIKDLISPDTLGPQSKMVLINALYFKGFWAVPFSNKSYEMKFYQHPSEVKTVPAMAVHARFPHGHCDKLDAQIVQLPYNDTDYSLVIIIPRSVDGLSNIEKELPFNMPQLLSNLHEENITLEIPKFNLTHKINLADEMKKLGMQDAFGYSANFKAMSAKEELYLSHAVQQTYIEVNEEGTTGAAGSNVNINVKSNNIVAANRPFLVILHKKSTDIPLLVGRVWEL